MAYYKVGKQVNFKKQLVLEEVMNGLLWATLILGFIFFILLPN